jgi:hypothetical protein
MATVQGPLLLQLAVTGAQPAGAAALEDTAAWLAACLGRAPAVLVVSFPAAMPPTAPCLARFAELLRLSGWSPRCGNPEGGGVAWSAWGRADGCDIDLAPDGSGFTVTNRQAS